MYYRKHSQIYFTYPFFSEFAPYILTPIRYLKILSGFVFIIKRYTLIIIVLPSLSHGVKKNMSTIYSWRFQLEILACRVI